MQPRRFKFFISVVFVLLAAPSFGQKSEKQIGLGTGWYYHSFKDASISATSQTGGSMSLLLFYRANGLKNRHHVQLLYAAPSLRSTYLLNREQVSNVQYAYHRKALLVSEFSLFAGGLLELNAFFPKYSELGNSYSYLNPLNTLESYASINPSVLIEKTLNTNKFSVQIHSVIGGYVFGGAQGSRGSVKVNDFVNTTIRLSYCKSLSTSCAGRIDYQLQTYRLEKYGKISSTTHQVNFSLVYKFR